MKPFIVHINNQHFELSSSDLDELDFVFQNGEYHLIQDNKAFKVKVVSVEGKSIELIVNNNRYHIQVDNSLDQLIDQMGLNVIKSLKIKDIKAPMPGIILEVLVNKGDQFEAGDGLLILEAMKMENVIKASGSGIVKSIIHKKGATVDKNQILIELE